MAPHEPLQSSGPLHTATGLEIPVSSQSPSSPAKEVHLVPISQPG